MKLTCLNCRGVLTIDAAEQKRIAEKLAGQPPAVREIIPCPCHLGEWSFALQPRRCTA